MDAQRVGLAALAWVPAGAFALGGLLLDLRLLLDPCHFWADEAISRAPGCARGVPSTSQTLWDFVRVTVALKLSLLAAATAGAVGVVRDRAELPVAAAWAIVLMAVPLMLGASGYVVAPSAILFLVASRELSTFPGAPRVAARVLSALVALALLAPLAWWIARDGWPTLWPGQYLVIAYALGLLGAAWWPLRTDAAAPPRR